MSSFYKEYMCYACNARQVYEQCTTTRKGWVRLRKRVQKQIQVEQIGQGEQVERIEGQDVISALPVDEVHVDSAYGPLNEVRQQALDKLMANTSDAVIALRQDYKLFEVNPAASSVLGISTHQIGELSCTEVLCCKNLNQMLLCNTCSCPLVRVLQQKKALPNEELIIGHERTCEVSASVRSPAPVKPPVVPSIFGNVVVAPGRLAAPLPPLGRPGLARVATPSTFAMPASEPVQEHSKA